MGDRTVEGSRAYQDLARFTLEWHRDRAEGFKRKAVAVLGFVGVVVALLPPLIPLMAEAHGNLARTSLKWLLVAAAASLAVSTGILATARQAIPAVRSRRW